MERRKIRRPISKCRGNPIVERGKPMVGVNFSDRLESVGFDQFVEK